LNGVPGLRQALNGEDASLALPFWHGLRVKIDVTRDSGTNLGAKLPVLSILADGEYERTLHPERWFVETLFGAGIPIGMRILYYPKVFVAILGDGPDSGESMSVSCPITRRPGTHHETTFAAHE